MTVRLTHVPAGNATLAVDPAAKKLTVHLKLIGLQPGKGHPAHIHVGTCESQGKVAIPLGQVVADEKGDFDQQIAIEGARDATANAEVTAIPAGKWYLNIHTGPALDTADQFRPILCGNVSAGGGSTAVVMAPLPGAGNNVAGTATIGLDRSAKRLTVEVKLTGLDPNSSHPNHLHLGQCEAQGPVKYALHSLTADADGVAEATTTIDGVSAIAYGAWYVNVHQGPGLDSQPQYTPISCANVVR